jgi:hypothetical protein
MLLNNRVIILNRESVVAKLVVSLVFNPNLGGERNYERDATYLCSIKHRLLHLLKKKPTLDNLLTNTRGKTNLMTAQCILIDRTKGEALGIIGSITCYHAATGTA